jgi:hypothetical protein
MKNSISGRIKRGRVISSARGFALVAAILACLILMALAILVISLSTGDLRTSATVVGDKKSLAAVESGIHKLSQNFDPSATAANFGLGASTTWQDVDATNDPGAQYRYSASAASTMPPLPLAGYSMEAGQGWGMTRYNITVEGQNTTYNTRAQVDVGIGYGPVPTGTMYQ